MSPTTRPEVVQPPVKPLPGEVARFWFTRPGDNNVGVGPYQASVSPLTLRGACISRSGEMTWKVFDNSADNDDIVVLDEGQMFCNGRTQTFHAEIEGHREVGVLGDTGSPQNEDGGESAWLVLANE
jgi:hypothetical protein